MAIESFNQKAKYNVIEINGNLYLWNSIRLRRESVPDNVHVYSVRESDIGYRLASIHQRVMVNHEMDILSINKIEGIENGIEIKDWSYLWELGSMTLQQFQDYLKERKK
ncbi:hypothetical protein IBB71_14280 [Listeria welshimeri]|uniref:LPD28 domain-containing protein n=1 Tax=Listeria welshimeri TaxID=1643 RepID=UPI001625C74D|nr:LPD28 domain-containing protein [Listeria welshimeri]MBC1982310.1 hypothetical protein [Listeria welshimeri]MBC2011183.1 hypothetical protein [Listeria welshimeri]MBF2474179.1 hypothetical protein [Listeria welshimeri]MBF2659649.1 hypothetical protein [Listeria welshimeri]